ncbi:hypothetical protein C169_20259 [Paenibacillus sp. FSL R5-808]|nr:hypothetical protein C169_20259 [Paenibacillus sp. FSL R5-808]
MEAGLLTQRYVLGKSAADREAVKHKAIIEPLRVNGLKGAFINCGSVINAPSIKITSNNMTSLYYHRLL